MDTIIHWITHYRYGGLFLLLVLGIVGVPLPDETLLTFTGFLVYKGQMHPAAALATAVIGSSCGITLSYLLGYFLGAWLIHRYGEWVHLTPARIERVHGWFERYGRWTLTFGYFVPGFRHVTAYAAGMTRTHYGIFAVFAYSGALLWATTFLTLGYYLGPEWQKVLHYVGHGHRIVLSVMAGAVVVAGIVWIIRKVRNRGNTPHAPT